jgi:methyl-accepting chemotaxis protein
MSQPIDGTAGGRFGVGTSLWSIRAQLLAALLLLAVMPVAIIGLFADRSASQAMREMASARLAAVARSRAHALESYAGERLRALRAAGRDPTLIAAFAEPAAAAHAAQRLCEALELEEVIVLAADGAIIASARAGTAPRDGGPPIEAALATEAIAAIALTGEPSVAMNAASEARATETPLWAFGPILREGALVGAIALRFDSAEIARIVADRDGLGDRGEVIVAAPETSAPGEWLVTASNDSEALTATARAPSFGWALLARQPTAEALAPLAQLRGTIVLAALLASVIAAVVAFAASRALSRPLAEAVAATRRLAEGDLTAAPLEVGHGESRQLLRAIRDTNADLSKLIGRIRATAGRIVASSGTVRSVARAQDHVVREFAASSAQVASATNQMNATSRQLTETMVGLVRAAEFAASTAASGRTSLVDLGKQMGRLNEGGRGVAARLSAIRERAARIDSMVAAITKVANQTNLLAVNAAIEAEKAGAAGHGFQVVAREIDRLATQTASNVLEIEETVVAVQQAVTEGVVEMSHFVDLVDEGCGTANGVASQMGLIIRQAEELRAEFEQVAHAVEAQSHGVAQVSDAMTRVAEGARRTAEAVERSASISTSLDEAAQTLAADVSRFRLAEPEGGERGDGAPRRESTASCDPAL